MDRDHFMSSEDAKKFGIVDKVVAERPKIENNTEKINWFIWNKGCSK